MDKLLAGKVALVTGGGRGMGWAMAKAFAEAGAKGVAIISSSSPDEIAKGAEELSRIAGRDVGLGMVADVRDDVACGEVVARTVEKFGALDILVNNAGLGMKNAIDGNRGPFWEAMPDGWDKVMGVNINGPFHMSRHAAKHLIASGKGRLINVSKTADSMHETRNSPYGPSKAALEAMTMCWAQDFLGTGVTANLILPGGLTATTFSRASAIKRARETGKAVFEPEDIAPLAVALASELSACYSGCRFNASGWSDKMSRQDALESCRTPAIFPKPHRNRELMTPWDALQGEKVS